MDEATRTRLWYLLRTTHNMISELIAAVERTKSDVLLILTELQKYNPSGSESPRIQDGIQSPQAITFGSGLDNLAQYTGDDNSGDGSRAVRRRSPDGHSDDTEARSPSTNATVESRSTQTTSSGTRSDYLAEHTGVATSNAGPRAVRRRIPEGDSEEPKARGPGDGNINARWRDVRRSESDSDDSTDSDESEARKASTNASNGNKPQQSSESPPQKDFLPPAVKVAVEKTEGIFNPVEFRSFLYMTRSVQNPVLMTEMTFTTDIHLVYYQLLALKFNITKEYRTDEEAPSEVREFLERLYTLIVLFNEEIQQTSNAYPY